ncbi:MAG: DUF5591 domain-containing protein [Candidatus Thermoplasmatota archaeon]|nr:DUF5591 domain-containing protein [Candidatus Thermoplasmatota archaeon]
MVEFVYEILERRGMARIGLLSISELQLATPNVLFVRADANTSMDWVEAYLSTEKIEKGILIDDLPDGDPKSDLPLSKPLSQDMLEFPFQEGKGDVSFLSEPREAAKAQKEIVALQNTVEFLRYPGEFVRAFITLREVAGYQRAIYAPLLATPANLPLLTYCGIDLVDVLRVYYDSRRGYFHSSEGRLPVDELDEWPCMCPACENQDLLEHNLRAMTTELRRSRGAIRRGDLREVVERRVANDPWMTAVLRELDYRCYEWQELHFPVVGPTLRAYSRESLFRPEVVRFRRRLKERYLKPASAQVLLLLPCSARKPYSASKSHRIFRSAIRASGNQWAVHVAVITSPMGLVPLDLELFYPVQHYDVPVTGDWSRDEASILEEDIKAFLHVNEYASIIVHLGSEAELVESAVNNALVSSREEPRSAEALERLQVTLKEATSSMPIVPHWRRQAENLRSIAEFQFGRGGKALVAECSTKGRYPNLRLFRDGKQVAALTRNRGMLSLTLYGGEILADADLHCVEIDDFYPEGNVFAVGVLDAHEDIRIGDDVVVRHGEEVRAVGVARMSPREMRSSDRGEAVRVRHRRKKARS